MRSLVKLARCNQDFLAEIMTKGLLKTTPPKLHPFSGEQLRGDVPYEQLEYEVKKALQSHTEKVFVRQWFNV